MENSSDGTGRLNPAFRFLCSMLLIAVAASCSATDLEEGQELPYPAMAARIVDALQPDGEHVILRFDPEALPGFPPVLRRRLERAGATVVTLPYGPVEDFEAALAEAAVYVALPVNPPNGATPEQAGLLVEWLDSGAGRQVHFHWGGGTVDPDGLVGEHSAVFDSIYSVALEIDYDALNEAQHTAIALLQSDEVRVTSPAGTDIRFTLGDRPVNQQNGDASAEAMGSARIRIDREVELPAGVVRVAPLEQSANGTIVIPRARLSKGAARDLRLTIVNGEVTEWTAAEGEAAFRAETESMPALGSFREFALGFNPRLVRPEGSPWLPYYGYGAGVVRLSLGNNEEIGGTVRGEGVRWFFFPDATVTVGDVTLVESGRLTDLP